MCPVEADDVPSEELCYFHQGICFQTTGIDISCEQSLENLHVMSNIWFLTREK